MNLHKITKLAAVGILSLGLTSCFISAQEEASIALAKWQGKKINDFFFKFGKGDFQAQSSQGTKAYNWSSPKRVVEIEGESYVVKVKSKYIPGKFNNKVITEPSEFITYQCVLRIETFASGTISSLQNVNQSGECARYFSLSEAEIEALLEARA